LPVRRTFTSWTSRLAGALALVLALGWAAPPAGAAENVGGSKPLSAQAQAKIAQAKPRAFQAATPGSPTETAGVEKKSFFHSTTGIIATIGMAAGAAYAIHTAFKANDVVHSPIR